MSSLLAGCSSMNATAVTPVAAGSPTAAPARQPDGYPNLNIAPAPAQAQLTDTERSALIDELSAKRPPANGTAAGATDTERLRLLARRHAEQTLNQIESSEQ